MAPVMDLADGMAEHRHGGQGQRPGGILRAVVHQDDPDVASVPAGGHVDGLQRLLDHLLLVVGGDDHVDIGAPIAHRWIGTHREPVEEGKQSSPHDEGALGEGDGQDEGESRTVGRVGQVEDHQQPRHADGHGGHRHTHQGDRVRQARPPGERHGARLGQGEVGVLHAGHGQHSQGDGREIPEEGGGRDRHAQQHLDRHHGGVDEGHDEQEEEGLEGDQQPADRIALSDDGERHDRPEDEEPEAQGEPGQIAVDLGGRANDGLADSRDQVGVELVRAPAAAHRVVQENIKRKMLASSGTRQYEGSVGLGRSTSAIPSPWSSGYRLTNG